MDPSPLSTKSLLSLSVMLQIDAVCDRFEDDVKAGKPAKLEDYLEDFDEPARSALLRQLQEVEIDYRRKAPANTGFVPTDEVDTADGHLRGANVPKIPRYEILEEIGRGGMGIVYKACPSGRDRLVALKMILSGRDASFFDLARFRVEAEAVACLQHPNVIRIYEVGVHGGCPYVALEFADGGSLARPSQGRPRSPRWAAEVVRSLAQAMQSVHDRGIVHRDLKPANVLLAADGTPKITDFGLAKFSQPMREVSKRYCPRGIGGSIMRLDDELERFWKKHGQKQRFDSAEDYESYVIERTWQEVMGTAATSPKGLARVKAFVSEARGQAKVDPPNSVSVMLGDLTRTGAIMGSPQYMAPEQSLGDYGEIGPATDIYGLGAVLYHLLAGRPPFQGGDLWQVLEKVRTEAPPMIQPKVHEHLEAICLKCLEKRPERRYANAKDLADDLQCCLDNCVTLESADLREVGQSLWTEAGDAQHRVSADSDRLSVPQLNPSKTKTWWQFWK